jgi:hypothetical protein
VENMRRRYTEVYDLNKLVLHYYDLFKNINGVTTEL